MNSYPTPDFRIPQLLDCVFNQWNPLLLSEESGWGYFGNRQLIVRLNWKETNQSKRKAVMHDRDEENEKNHTWIHYQLRAKSQEPRAKGNSGKDLLPLKIFKQWNGWSSIPAQLARSFHISAMLVFKISNHIDALKTFTTLPSEKLKPWRLDTS